MAETTLSGDEFGDGDRIEALSDARIYGELRRLAAAKLHQEAEGHTLNATALVHEAFLKLGNEKNFATKGDFMRAAAVAMRRVLIDHARAKKSDKRGGGRKKFELTDDPISPVVDEDLLALDQALEAFAKLAPEAAELVSLRYFTGLSIAQAAESLGISTRTANRHWTYARAWLFRQISENPWRE